MSVPTAAPSPDELAAAVRRVQQEILSRAPEAVIDPSLDRIAGVLDLLGSPQLSFPVLALTGTNGKTSTARMVDALLSEFGLRTGRFTSPHLQQMQERIAFDGVPIEDERFVAAWADIAPYVTLVDDRPGGPRMSFFEVLVALAYAAFADAPVDVAVVEVGLGGTWDATNVADAQVAVVLPVAIDHVDYLGSTVELIATEKAGIIKPGELAVLAVQAPEVHEILTARVAEVGATAVREGIDFGVRDRRVAVGGQQLVLQGLSGVYDDIFLPLHGAHQAHNAVVALAAVEAFLGGGTGQLDADVVRAGFARATSPGRLEIVRSSPTVLLDAAHNPAGAQATAGTLAESFDFTRLVGVVAIMADKDARGILEAFEPVLAEIVVTEAATPRAMPVDDLAAIAVEVFGEDRVEVVTRLDDALDAGLALAEEDGDLSGAGVLVTGSIVTVGQVRSLLGRR